jgi:ABC-type nickel/cobalt efflux system permease component RcnA
MRIVHRIINIFFLVVGVCVAFTGTHEMNDAHNWLELLRGLFWLVIGVGCFWSSVYDLQHGRKWYQL